MSYPTNVLHARAYPLPPARPQAYRRRARRGRAAARLGVRTWHFCLAALALLACATAVMTSRSASAAPAPTELAARVAVASPGGVLPPGVPVTAPASLGGRSPGPLLEPPQPGEPAATAASVQAAPAARLTSPAAILARLGPGRQGRQLRAQVTAYSASEEEGTAWGITRSGTRARPGVVAVDPRVIPLGSRVRIAGLPGVYRAEDTGGGIIGAHVDVFMESRDEALRFGRQTSVLIEVLD